MSKISQTFLLLAFFSLIVACFVRGLPKDYGNVYDMPYKVRLNEEGLFVDPHGRVLIFHGINSVTKEFPWYPKSLLNETQLKLYEEWGFNSVRLGTMWTGFMPQKDRFNQTYIDIQGQIINLLAKYGMYSLLDMHQDVISTRYESYDGVPPWLIDMFPNATGGLKFPWPLKSAPSGANWFEGYLTYAVGNAFQHLYSNTSGSLVYWSQFWDKVASVFGKRNSVLGYELINEPWAGNVFTDPLRILPGYAGRNNLLPVYDNLTQSIRKIDSDTLIFYEPVTWGVYFSGGGDAGSGFDRVPGGPTQASKSVLSYHYYCWLLQMPSPARPYPHWERLVCDSVLLEKMFAAAMEDVRITGGGAFLTEFGECAPDNSSQSVNTVECEEVLRQADNNIQSWTYWDSNFFNTTTGEPFMDRVKTFARAYPRATAGLPKTIKFDVKSGAFEFSYSLNATMSVPTLIFLPTTVHYKEGFSVTTSPRMETTFDVTKKLLSVAKPTGTSYPDGTLITVSVSQKKDS